MKKVTQIVCYYNEERFIGECIQSLLDQTYKNLEIILVNDGSTDNSEQIVDTFKDPRIIKLSNKENHGLAWGRNRGLEIATGDYVGFFDADDISERHRIEKLVSFLDSHEDIMVVSGYHIDIDERGHQINVIYSYGELDDIDIRVKMLFGNIVAGPCALIRRAVLEEHHIRNVETLRLSQDYQFWLQCMKVGRFKILDEVLFYYRVHDSQSKKIRRKNEDEYQRIMIEIFKYAWMSQGMNVSFEEAEFIYTYLYKKCVLWKFSKLKKGRLLYLRIQESFPDMSSKEKEMIKKTWRKNLIESLMVTRYWNSILNIMKS